MKKTPPKIIKGILYSLLLIACLFACWNFTLLPQKTLNTEIVYKGF